MMIILTQKKVCSYGRHSRGVVIPKEFIGKKKYVNILIFEDCELKQVSGVVRDGL